MTKQQTLDYILRVYRKVNQFYLSENTYMHIPVGIDSATLEYDQLVFYYKLSGDKYVYSGPRSATISGDLEIDESYDGIKNADKDWVLRVQEQNTAELKRLYYALQHLQNFIESDPFSGQVNQYEQNKTKENADKKRQREEQQLANELERRHQAKEYEEERRSAEARQRRAEEQQRREKERRGKDMIEDLQREFRKSTGGGN